MIERKDLPEFVGQVVDIFEDFLTERGIVLHNSEREEAVEDGADPEEIAVIYGTDYGQLQDQIEAMLVNWELVKPE